MSNFWQRTATGAVLAAAVLGALAAGHAAWRVLLFIIAVGCVGEYARMKPRGFWATAGGAAAIVFCLSLMAALPREWALGMVLTVWANDVFAYIIGMALGRHRMAPTVSPKKSWEGFAGGVVGAVAVAAILGWYLFDGQWIGWAVGGFFMALAAVGGDLLESAVKRRAGVKDSGRALPGHGGFLDRFDAMMGAAPVAFLFYVLVEVL